MEYEKTVRQVRHMEKTARLKKIFTISLFSVLLSLVVLYAVRVENRISELANAQNVIVFRDDETTVVTDTCPAENNIADNTDDVTTEVDASNKATVSVSSSDDSGHTEEASELVTSGAGSVSEHEIDEAVYYVTKSGRKYHIDGCSYLKSKIEITYDDIIAGGYEPCSRCIK